jgi:carbamoyl-phosphate synthase large subunit
MRPSCGARANSGYSRAGIARLTGSDAYRGDAAIRRISHGRYGRRRVSGALALLLSLALRATRCAAPREAVVVVGSGPIRIGQGIEFDYSCVHAAWALREAGRAAVVVNNNPETVSTDFDVSDVLVFEPPGADEVQAAYDATGATGVMLAFGGQTAINLAAELSGAACASSAATASLDMAEDREKFEAALAAAGRRAPEGRAAARSASAHDRARTGLSRARAPVVRAGRPRHGDRLQRRPARELRRDGAADHAGAPLLVDKYLRGLEVEVDAVYDGRTSWFPASSNTSNAPGIHSGDSISVYPPQTIDAAMQARIVERHARDRARAADARADQHPIRHPRRRTVHHRSQPAREPHGADHLEGDRHQPRRRGDARRARRKARDMPYGTGLLPDAPFVVVKVPVFSFAKMRGVETILGPEMKSTGEVLGIDATFAGALRKGFVAAGIRVPAPAPSGGRGGRILVSISDEDKARGRADPARVRGPRLHAGRNARHARAAVSRTASRPSASTRSQTARRTCSTRSSRARSISSSTREPARSERRLPHSSRRRRIERRLHYELRHGAGAR